MPASVTFAVDARTVADLNRVLNPKQVRTAIYTAVKRTTAKGRQIAAKAVLERLTIPRKYVDTQSNRYAAIRTAVSGGDEPVGKITVKDIPLPLTAFKYRESRAGVSVTADKTVPPIFLRHGFVATVASPAQVAQGTSHKGIFSRAKVDVGRADFYFQKNHASKLAAIQKKAITPRGYAWRLPIDEHYGPSVLDFISRQEIKDRVERDIGHELPKQIDSQVSRFLRGRATSLSEALAQLGDGNDPSTDATNDAT